MATDEVKALLVALEDAEERYRRYGRRADLFDLLYLPLLILGFVFLLLGAVVYELYGYDHRPLLIVSIVLWAAGYLSYILHIIYNSRAVKAAKQACELRCMLLKPETDSAKRI